MRMEDQFAVPALRRDCLNGLRGFAFESARGSNDADAHVTKLRLSNGVSATCVAYFATALG